MSDAPERPVEELRAAEQRRRDAWATAAAQRAAQEAETNRKLAERDRERVNL